MTRGEIPRLTEKPSLIGRTVNLGAATLTGLATVARTRPSG
jgi:hypothetical protein